MAKSSRREVAHNELSNKFVRKQASVTQAADKKYILCTAGKKPFLRAFYHKKNCQHCATALVNYKGLTNDNSRQTKKTIDENFLSAV